MGLDFAIEELYASGWSTLDSTGCGCGPDGRVFPGIDRVRAEFESSGLELTIRRVTLFDCCRAEWRLPSGQAIPMEYCNMVGAYRTQVKGFGAYTIPRIDVSVAATLQNIPGQEIEARWAVPNAVAQPLLGRPLAGNSANLSLNLLPPQQHFSDRTNQIDLRIGKILRFGQKRTQITFDLYNATNSNTVQTSNASYTPNGIWRLPNAILSARFAKITAQFDF